MSGGGGKGGEHFQIARALSKAEFRIVPGWRYRHSHRDAIALGNACGAGAGAPHLKAGIITHEHLDDATKRGVLSTSGQDFAGNDNASSRAGGRSFALSRTPGCGPYH
jgi:hypothetical protein